MFFLSITRVLQDVALEHAAVRERRMAASDRRLPLVQNLLSFVVVLGTRLGLVSMVLPGMYRWPKAENCTLAPSKTHLPHYYIVVTSFFDH
jgi:hypothetical protein